MQANDEQLEAMYEAYWREAGGVEGMRAALAVLVAPPLPPKLDQPLPKRSEIQWVPGQHYATQLDEHYDHLYAAYEELRARLARAESDLDITAGGYGLLTVQYEALDRVRRADGFAAVIDHLEDDRQNEALPEEYRSTLVDLIALLEGNAP